MDFYDDGGAGSTGPAQKQPKHLLLRNGIYYFKRKVPKYARAAFDMEVVWRSLETADFDEAVAKLETEVREFEQTCSRAKSKKTATALSIDSARERADGASKFLLEEYIPVLLQRFEHSFLVMDDEERRELKTPDGPDDIRTTTQRVQDRVGELQEALGAYQASLAVDDWESVEDIANALLAQESLIAPPGSRLREEFCRQLLRKEVEVLKNQIARLAGEGSPTPAASTYPLPPRQLPTLRDLFKTWAKGQRRQRTIDTYEYFVAEFEALHGPLPVTSIRPEHVWQYRDVLRTRVKTIETAKNRIGGLATLIRFGQQEIVRGLPDNPFDRIDLTGFAETPDSEKRRAYEVGELQTLFSSPLYTAGYRAGAQTEAALYWTPLIAAFTGCRMEELAQLQTQDIAQLEGTWAIRIRESTEGQQVKNENSKRDVPVHEELLRCGFVAYAQEMKLQGHSQLFPGLRNSNKYRRWAAALGKRYAAYLDRIGLGDPRLDFQSHRYSFRQQCTICGLTLEARDALTGHWGEDEGKSVYVRNRGKYPFPALVENMNKFAYKNLDLTHLYHSH
jgi:integrase